MTITREILHLKVNAQIQPGLQSHRQLLGTRTQYQAVLQAAATLFLHQIKILKSDHLARRCQPKSLKATTLVSRVTSIGQSMAVIAKIPINNHKISNAAEVQPSKMYSLKSSNLEEISLINTRV